MRISAVWRFGQRTYNSWRIYEVFSHHFASAFVSKSLSIVFVSSRMDYCNALLHGVSEGLLRRVQSVQNAAARLVTMYAVHLKPNS